VLMRDLHGRRHPIHHNDLVAPVELVGLARRERQRHIGVQRPRVESIGLQNRRRLQGQNRPTLGAKVLYYCRF
jgi:hypothetical protein